MKLKVLVAGDPTVDQFLQYLPPQEGSQRQDWESHERYSLQEIRGGVHQTIANLMSFAFLDISSYIAHRPKKRELCSLVEMMCIDTSENTAVPTRTPAFKEGMQDSRVEIFRGYSERKRTESTSSSEECTDVEEIALNGSAYLPDVTVLNDAGGQLRVDLEFQKYIQKTVSLNKVVIHKCHLPLDSNNAFQQVLTSSKLTNGVLHLSASDLRRSDIRLRANLSWANAISDLRSAVVENDTYLNRSLDKYAAIVIQFDVEGVALLTKDASGICCDLITDSSLSEGDLALQMPGYSFGKMNAFLTSLVKFVCEANPKAPEIPTKNEVLLALAQTRLYAKSYFKIIQDKANKESYSISFPSLNFPSKDLDAEVESLTSETYNFQCDPRNSTQTRKDMLDMAVEIVEKGFDKISNIPHLRLGELLTIDNREISAFRSIKRLLEAYLSDESRNKPLSISVFGAPGSGKSFGLKQIAKPLGMKVFEFNLSEIEAEDLPGIFHELRDESLNGKVPLCFFDEFDRNEYELISRFLAPMQDGVFRDKGRTHPIGRVVFVFAGGLVDTLEGLRNGDALKSSTSPNLAQEDVSGKLRVLKIPDFVSRLNGFIEIQSINPDRVIDGSSATSSGSDYILRRAVLLRSMLQRFAEKSAIDTAGNALLSKSMINAFLLHAEYRSDARSMEKIITMSSLNHSTKRFTASDLPPERLLQMHLQDATKFLEEASRTPSE